MTPESLPSLKVLLNSASDINDDGDDSAALLKAGLFAFAAGLASDLTPVSDRVAQIATLQESQDIIAAVQQLKADLPDLLRQSIQKPAAKTAIASAISAGFLNGVNEGADSGTPLTTPTPFSDVADRIKKDGTLPEDDVASIGSDFSDRADWAAASTKANLLDSLNDQLDEILSSGDNAPSLDEISDGLDFDDADPEDGIASKASVLGTALSIPALAIGFGLLSWGAENPDDAGAWEYYREWPRNEWRNWPERWVDAGGQFYEDSDSGVADYPEGRMIAPAYDDIFLNLSRFGTYWPPFDFNSGMWIRLIPLDDAKQLGVVGDDQDNNPPDLDFNSNVQFNGDLDPALRKVLLESLGDDFEYDEEANVIRLKSTSITNSYRRVIRQIRNRKETKDAIRNTTDDNPLQREPAWKLMMPRKIKQPFHVSNAKPIATSRKPFRVPGRKVLNDNGGLATGGTDAPTGSMSSLGSFSSKPFIKRFATRS